MDGGVASVGADAVEEAVEAGAQVGPVLPGADAERIDQETAVEYGEVGVALQQHLGRDRIEHRRVDLARFQRHHQIGVGVDLGQRRVGMGLVQIGHEQVPSTAPIRLAPAGSGIPRRKNIAVAGKIRSVERLGGVAAVSRR